MTLDKLFWPPHKTHKDGPQVVIDASQPLVEYRSPNIGTARALLVSWAIDWVTQGPFDEGDVNRRAFHQDGLDAVDLMEGGVMITRLMIERVPVPDGPPHPGDILVGDGDS